MRKKNNDHSKPCPILSCAKGVIIVLIVIALVISSIAAIYMSFSAKDKVKELEDVYKRQILIYAKKFPMTFWK